MPAAMFTGAQNPMFRRLAKTHLLVIPLLGGDTFANPTGVIRVEQARLAVQDLNVEADRIGLIGSSMGAAVSLAYARAYPQRVKYVAGTVPLMDLKRARDENVLGLGAAFDAAYGGEYDDVSQGPNHNPVRFAQQLPVDLPIRLWTSSNDTVTPPSTAQEFKTLRPQTEVTNMGAVGHSQAASQWAATNHGLVEWCSARA